MSSYNFGPEELDLLIEEWLKDPKPKTINELARIYLIHRIKEERDFWPYDIRRSYKEKDRIIVRLRKEEELFDCVPAEVLSVTKNAYRNIGYYGDYIDVRLLSTDSKLDSQRIRTFVANYQGPGFSIPEEFKAFEIITEKDEAEVVPKILLAISSDKRFVSFGNELVPTQLLIDVSDKLNDVEKIIAECKHSMSTGNILDKMRIGNNKKESNPCLEFSLNHYLSRDKRFVREYDTVTNVTKWKLRVMIKPPEKRQWTVTIPAKWIENGVIIVPRELATYMQGTNTVHILYDQRDEVLPYEEKDRLIEGLNDFYSMKAIDEGDKIYLQLQGLETTRLFISFRGQRRLERLLRLEPTDLQWEHLFLRDCIIIILAKFKQPAHYREIYPEIAPHKNTSLGSIIATLSHYSPSVFTHVGWGRWQLAGWAGEMPSEAIGIGSGPPQIIDLDEEIWKAVQFIEEKDYVYKLLQKIKRPLSFNDICEKIANLLKVDANKLKATGFLSNDKRLRRLDDGTWALEEWFPPEEKKEDTEPCGSKDENESIISPCITTKSGISRLFWAIVLILFFLITIGVILFWRFI